MSFDRETIKSKISALALRNIYIGTSSWKYPGWCGPLYESARYEYRGKFAKTRFNRDCLSEYSEVFKTVCFDGARYFFPTAKYLQDFSVQVPDDFRFGFKVTEDITTKRYTKFDGPALAGTLNKSFLDSGKFIDQFLGPCDTIRSKVGVLIFQFSTFYSNAYQHSEEFLSDLDNFLSKLPKNWPYSVELRNANWLKPEYFECLKRHNVAHTFNSWAEMPPVSEQRALLGSETSETLSASRFLLKQGRKYQNAVDLFEPYNETKDVNEEARQAGALLIADAKKAPTKKTFIFVNNRLEGNALNTIDAMISMAEITET